MAKKAGMQKYGSDEPKEESVTVRLMSVTGSVGVTPTSTGANSPVLIKITANFTAPAPLPTGIAANLTATPTCKLLRRPAAGSPFADASGTVVMNQIAAKTFEFTFGPFPPGIYGAFVSGNWSLGGTIPDTTTIS